MKAKIIIPSHRKIQLRLDKSVRGYKYRIKCRAKGLDTTFLARADNLPDAADLVIAELNRLNDDSVVVNNSFDHDLPVALHTWREIFDLLDNHSDNGAKQVSSAKTATRRILRGIGDTEEDYPHQATKERVEEWFEGEVKHGRTEEEKLVIKKKLNKSLAQVRYGVFKRNMIKYYKLGVSFDLDQIKILRFKPIKYKRPTDDRHERADRHFNEVVKFEEPALFGFYQLMRISAQRNIEVAFTKRENLLPDYILNDRIVPKKNESEREIPYPENFTEVDRQFLLNLNPGGEYVLPGTDWDRHHGFSKRVNDLLRPFRFTAYKLRKEWACQLLDQNIPVQVVAQLMGNTVQVLVDHYVAAVKPKFNLQLG